MSCFDTVAGRPEAWELWADYTIGKAEAEAARLMERAHDAAALYREYAEGIRGGNRPTVTEGTNEYYYSDVLPYWEETQELAALGADDGQD